MTQKYSTKVGSEHMDVNNHVGYDAFLALYKAAHADFLTKQGASFDEISDSYNGTLFVRHADVEYCAPVYEGDSVDIETRVAKMGNTSVTFHSEMKRDNKLVSSSDITTVFVDKGGKAMPLPKSLREKLE